MICSQSDVQCERVDSRVVPSVTHVDADDFPEEHIRFERSAERDCEHEVSCLRSADFLIALGEGKKHQLYNIKAITQVRRCPLSIQKCGLGIFLIFLEIFISYCKNFPISEPSLIFYNVPYHSNAFLSLAP